MKDLKVIVKVMLLSTLFVLIGKTEWKTSKRHNGTSIDLLNIWKMANINKANLDYILKWEGGLSKHPRDSAARHPVPDGSGHHTNKGITFRLWASVHGSTAEWLKAAPIKTKPVIQ